MTFALHPNLACKVVVTDLPLCSIFLEDNRHYPWLFLVPRRPNISRMIDLTTEDYMQLMLEIAQAQEILCELFSPTQLNVAAIGNKTPQLHVHVIARKESDPAWPGVVWDHPIKEPYSERERTECVASLVTAFERCTSSNASRMSFSGIENKQSLIFPPPHPS